MKNINTLFPGPPLFIIKNELVCSPIPKLTNSTDTLDAFVFLAGVSLGVFLWVEYNRSL
jgi:hypothetical protein